MSQIYNHINDIINADKNLNAGERAVFKLLVGLSHSKKSIRVSISRSLIAVKAGVSDSTAKRALKKLRELDYVKIDKRGGYKRVEKNGVITQTNVNSSYVIFDMPNDFYIDSLQKLKTVKKTVSSTQKFEIALKTLQITRDELAQIRLKNRENCLP